MFCCFVTQGQGTAELVGLGGESTWGVLGSLLDSSGGEDQASPTKRGATLREILTSPNERKKAKKKKKKRNNAQANADSEEDETVQLTNSELGGSVGMEVESSETRETQKVKAMVDGDATATVTAKPAASGPRRSKRKGKGDGNGDGRGGGDECTAQVADEIKTRTRSTKKK